MPLSVTFAPSSCRSSGTALCTDIEVQAYTDVPQKKLHHTIERGFCLLLRGTEPNGVHAHVRVEVTIAALSNGSCIRTVS